ncbi:hypothetical protein [Streptomyces sp. NPDC048623]|uniref:hypothetical protein n=1 Tax=Streptomyces sp. NPDC048623 TaxID=3155761 RepID=UPI00341FC9BD
MTRPSSTALALAALGTAAGLSVAAPAPAAPAAPAPVAPACGAVGGKEFPLATRIHGGPVEYPAGGELRTWSLDLTNTTAAPCRDVHPILVLTDRDRVLRPGQIRAEFYDAEARIWRPVAFESTDQAENVGVFEGPVAPVASAAPVAPVAPTNPIPAVPAFAGFAVPAGRTLTVPVRLAFGADAPPDEVTVNAAVVQKRGDDGDWVGESGEYRLTIGPAETEPDPDRDPRAEPQADPRPTGTAPAAPALPADPELASTGRKDSALRLAPVAAALLTTGAAAVLFTRRARRSRRP